MSDRTAVIGFTEAEIGFFLVFAMVLLYLIASPVENGEPANVVQVPKAEWNTLQDSVARLMEAIGAVSESRDSMARLLARMPRRNTRSNLRPPCQEVGVASGDLFHAHLLAEDTWQVGEWRGTGTQMVARVDEAMAQARSVDCVYTVSFTFTSTLSSSVVDAGRRRLERDFYPRSEGPR